tara:strand:+ start:2592 stop:3599 length:1008 start_codon:yes stop_codon:yes gene_type:complete
MKVIKLKYWIIFLFLTTLSVLKGQDFHYSMNQLSPLNLNPALTGWYDGDLRINSNHRSQWKSVSTPFNTYSLSTDFSNSKSIPFGILINQDIAGDSKFKTLQFNMSFSLNLVKDSLQLLRIGFQGGYTSRSIHVDDLSFDAQYNGSFFDPNLSTLEDFNNFKTNYGNVNSGILYVRKLGQKQYIKSHLSCFNLNQSDQSFMGASPSIPIDIKLVSKLEHQLIFNNFFQLQTSLFFLNQGPHSEILVGSEFHYTLAELLNIKRKVWMGLYYRNKDAIFITAGLTYDSWNFGISYDINLSELVPASRQRGGFEIALAYLFKRKIKMESSTLICPDYL